MIWVTEVIPPSTQEQLPPFKAEFLRKTQRAKADFQSMLDTEIEKLKENEDANMERIVRNF